MAHLQKLEAQGVDVAPFVAAQQANNALEPDSAAFTRERTRATFASEKRKLLQAMAGYITQKVAKGLKAVKADNASALDRNRRQQESLFKRAVPSTLRWICSVSKPKICNDRTVGYRSYRARLATWLVPCTTWEWLAWRTLRARL